MAPTRHVALAALLLWLAAIAQGRMAHALSIRGAQPDFPLVVLACAALLTGGAGGTVLGFWGGWLSAVSSPAAFGGLFVSRLAAGVFAGSLQRSLIRENLLVPPLVTLAATALAELLCTLIAPSSAVHHPRRWAALLGGEMLYNAALALPVALLLRGLRVGRAAPDPFGGPS